MIRHSDGGGTEMNKGEKVMPETEVDEAFEEACWQLERSMQASFGRDGSDEEDPADEAWWKDPSRRLPNVGR
jgi:hypothetical protein